jgi:hypothetical protein
MQVAAWTVNNSRSCAARLPQQPRLNHSHAAVISDVHCWHVSIAQL